MPYAAGTFTLVAGNPVVTGTIVSSTWANTTLSDIATGLSTAVLKDGTQVTTAAVPFGTFGASFTEGTALKNYATGTWTPAIKFGATVSGTTYAIQSGAYQRTGGKVDASFFITFTSKGSVSASGLALLTGLPFTVASFFSPRLIDYSLMTSSLLYMAATPNGSTTTAFIVGGATAQTGMTQLRASDFADNTVIQAMLTYFV